MHISTTISAGPLGPGPNSNIQPWIFLQRPSNPNHNHVLHSNHECWAQGPTLMYNHECFYSDPATLITTICFRDSARLSRTLSSQFCPPTRPSLSSNFHYRKEIWHSPNLNIEVASPILRNNFNIEEGQSPLLKIFNFRFANSETRGLNIFNFQFFNPSSPRLNNFNFQFFNFSNPKLKIFNSREPTSILKLKIENLNFHQRPTSILKLIFEKFSILEKQPQYWTTGVVRIRAGNDDFTKTHKNIIKNTLFTKTH